MQECLYTNSKDTVSHKSSFLGKKPRAHSKNKRHLRNEVKMPSRKEICNAMQNEQFFLNRAHPHRLLPLHPPPILIPKLNPPNSPQSHRREQQNRPHTRDDQTDREESKAGTGEHKRGGLGGRRRRTGLCLRATRRIGITGLRSKNAIDERGSL